MVRYSSPAKSVSRMRNSMSNAPKSRQMPSTRQSSGTLLITRLSYLTAISRVSTRNRLFSPFRKLRNMHKCTCKAHHQSPTSEGQDTFIEYREEDQFSDMGDGTILDQDEDGLADFDWDEHATLIALLDDAEEGPDFNNREVVVDRLQPAFTAHGRAAKEQFRDILIPVISHVGDTHKRISRDIHPSLLRGVALFDKSSRVLEDAARREQDQVVSTYARVTEAIQELSLQLQGVCAESDKLFDGYEKAINEHVQRLRDYARSVPGNIERLISKLDKTHKSIAAEDHAKAKEKLLRGILDKY